MRRIGTLLFVVFAALLVAGCPAPTGPDDQAPPGVVTSLAATAGDGFVTLTWVDPEDEDLARVDLSWLPGEGSGSALAGVQAFNATELTNETEYIFTLTAIDSAGNASSAVTAEATPSAGVEPDTEAPDPVTGLATAAGDQNVTLTWTDPAAPDLLEIEVTQSPGAETMTVEPGVEELTSGALVNETEYAFTVVAVDASGNRSTSTQITATPLPDLALSAPVLAADDDTGPFDTDGVTSRTTALSLSGSGADSGRTIRLYADGSTLLGEDTAQPDGSWALEVDLSEGSYELVARAIGASGATIAESDPATVTIDTTAPTTAPVLLSPHVGEDTGADLTPTFRWAGGDGAYAAIEADEDPGFGSPDYSWSNLGGGSFEPSVQMAVETTAPVGRRYYFRIRAVDAAGNEGPWQMEHYVDVGRYHNDFNGDGYSDLIVGAIDFNSNRGRTYLYYGNESADIGQEDLVGNGADVVIDGETINGYFGEVVTSAGDVNNDGFADLLVSERSEGYVYLFLGASDWSAPAGTPLAASNADLTYSESGRFGWSAQGVGDIDADGYDDIGIGADGFSVDRGAFYIYLGDSTPDTTADVSVQADLDLPDYGANHLLGSAISAAGDLNGDGYADWAVGARAYDDVATDGGAVYLYYGASTPDGDVDLKILGDTVALYLGRSVAHAGDVNGDGYSDLIVGSQADAAYLYYGGTSMDAGSDVDYLSEKQSFGRVVAGVGDLNGDSYDDLVIGAPAVSVGMMTGAGQAYVFYGGATPSTSAGAVIDGEATLRIGYAVARLGDLDADGHADLILGTSHVSAGRVRGFFGGTLPTGGGSISSTSSDFAKIADGSSARYGVSVGSAGARGVLAGSSPGSY